MRSTPSPWTMRRTVNIAPMPPPRRAITVPLKTCTRSFWPSRMRTWTSTWSPTWNSGTSFLRAASSTRALSRFFMAVTFLFHRLRWLVQALPSAAGLGLFASPAGDGRVIAAKQDLRDFHAAENARPSVLRILQAAWLAVGLLAGAGRVAQDAGHQPNHGINHHHGRHF